MIRDVERRLKAFGRVAILEATSFIALLIATVIKHSDGGELGVTVLGPIHGVLFIVYVLFALALRRSAGWSLATTSLIVLGAVAPFGGYVVEAWLARQLGPHTPDYADG